MSGNPDDPLLLDRQICFLLYAASNLMTRQYRPLLQPLGLTYPQYLVMLVLWECGEAGMAEIGERLYLDSGTLTPLLKRLEAAGCVSRHRDPADERRLIIRLTEQGAQLKQEAVSIPLALAAASNMTKTEIWSLRSALKQAVATLSAGLAG